MNLYNKNEVLTIKDYTKFIIDNFKDELTNVEISKMLGISRKTLYEKRKKYDLGVIKSHGEKELLNNSIIDKNIKPWMLKRQDHDMDDKKCRFKKGDN